MPASTPDLVRRELLDPYGIDIGLLTADDGIAVSLMASPYRAAAYARAHNDWLRDCWLDADPRLRGTIVVPAQDPLAAAEEINRVARTLASRRCCCAAGRAPYGDPRYLPVFAAAAGTACPSPSTPVLRDWASRPAPAEPACPASTSSGTRWGRPAAS
jgi:predicted TIM-barrel fold metal-dependent hydrolase